MQSYVKCASFFLEKNLEKETCSCVLYIIRHADPDYQNDTLTPAGHLEAQALARRLASYRLDRIYCSPMQRARHTMQYTADLVKIPPLVEEWMREFSDWRIEEDPWGRIMVWDLPGEVIRARQPLPNHDTWHQVPHFNDQIFQEGFEHLKQASDAFLENYGYKREGGRYRILKASPLQIAIFCHQGLGVTWLAAFAGNSAGPDVVRILDSSQFCDHHFV